MRSLTSAERSYISDPKGHDCFAFLEVTADDWTTWKNLGDLAVGGNQRDFFNTATLSDSIDSNTISFSATLKREIDVDSLSPFRTDSAVNDSVVSPGTYAPLIDLQRQWRIMVALVPKGIIPDLSDYRELNSGYIRSFVVNGLEDTIDIQGMGMEAPILDAFVVQDPSLPGRTSVGDRPYSGNQEDVIQDALDDQLGSGVVSLSVPGGPTGEAVQDEIGDINLQPALSDIAALTGAVLRYRYDDADVNRYTLFMPPRSTTTPDFSIAATEYEDLSASADVTGVRNFIYARWNDPSGGIQTTISPGAEAGTVSCTGEVATFSTSQAGVLEDGALIVVDWVGYRVSDFDGTTSCTLVGAPDFTGKKFYTSASLTKYGLQVLGFDLATKTQITDATAAGNFTAAVLADRQDPSLTQTFKAPGLWFVQLCDYVNVIANNVHADEDHAGGVTSYTMTFADAMLDVQVNLAASVKGRFTTWKRVGSGTGASTLLPELSYVAAEFYDSGAYLGASDFGQFLLSAYAGDRCFSVRILYGTDPTFGTATTVDVDPGGAIAGFTLTSSADRDKTYYFQFIPYSGELTGGAVTGIPGDPVTRQVYVPPVPTNSSSVSFSRSTTGELTATVPAVATLTTDLSTETAARIAGDAAQQAYTDAKVAGLSWKQAVRVATTGAGTLASSFENGDTVDGVTLATGDRILIKNQATASENGIYTVNASGAPTRATDADSGAELVNATCYVSEGTTNADTVWTCTTNATITLGSTSLAFAQSGSGAGVTDGDKGDIVVSGGGTSWLFDSSVVTTAAKTLLDDTTTSAMRATLGLSIGTDVAAALVTINTQTASYTLVLADANASVQMNVASANNLTVPPNASVAFPIGTVIEVVQYGAGSTTIVAGSGVTIRTAGTLVLRTQYSVVSLLKIGTNEWELSGDMT